MACIPEASSFCRQKLSVGALEVVGRLGGQIREVVAPRKSSTGSQKSSAKSWPPDTSNGQRNAALHSPARRSDASVAPLSGPPAASVREGIDGQVVVGVVHAVLVAVEAERVRRRCPKTGPEAVFASSLRSAGQIAQRGEQQGLCGLPVLRRGGQSRSA